MCPELPRVPLMTLTALKCPWFVEGCLAEAKDFIKQILEQPCLASILQGTVDSMHIGKLIRENAKFCKGTSIKTDQLSMILYQHCMYLQTFSRKLGLKSITGV